MAKEAGAFSYSKNKNGIQSIFTLLPSINNTSEQVKNDDIQSAPGKKSILKKKKVNTQKNRKISRQRKQKKYQKPVNSSPEQTSIPSRVSNGGSGSGGNSGGGSDASSGNIVDGRNGARQNTAAPPVNQDRATTSFDQVKGDEIKPYLITDFSTFLLNGWSYDTYGNTVENTANGSLCRIRKNTYNRCGVATHVREIDYGLGVKNIKGVEVTVINLGKKEITFIPEIFASWFESEASFALISGYPSVRSSQTFSLGILKPGESKTTRIPWNRVSFSGFDPSTDFFAGISFMAIDGTEDTGIQKIALYGESDPVRIVTNHSGGSMILERASDGKRFTYTTFDGTTWGEPFAGQKLQKGDRIEVYGVVNAGTVIGFTHGTVSEPITLIGMTPDAGFDGKNASKLGQNGGLITLYGNYWVIKNLTLRNCGLPYGGHENASAFHTTTQYTVFSNLKVYNCGDGFLFSPTSKNSVIENSDIFNNGYFQSGQTHNLYIQGEGNIIRNNRIHHSGGQNLKSRGWKNIIENNLIWNAGNFDVDFAGATENPGGSISIFRGNTVIKSSYSDNRWQFFTFFEDNFNQNISDRLLVVNNTFIGPKETSLFRVGKNKILEAYNNVVIGVDQIQYQGNTDRENGELTGSNNWFFANARYLGSLRNSIFGIEPGLQLQNQVYRPIASSPLIDQGKKDVPELPLFEYHWPQSAEARLKDGKIDIGAFEYQQTAQGTAPATSTSTSTPTSTACEQKWQCVEWGSCGNGKQQRNCIDVNQCGVTINMPVTEQNCVEPQVTQINCVQDETIILTRTSPDENRFGIDQSYMTLGYPDFGYNSNDNPLNESSRYNIHFRALKESLPANRTVKKVELKLYFYNQYDPALIGIYLFNESWEGMGHASWSLRQGASDAENNFSPSSLEKLPWKVRGGSVDMEKIITATITNATREYGFFRNIDITPLVRKWFAGQSNEGLQIRAEQGTITDLFGVNYFRHGGYYGPSLILTLECAK